MAIVVQISSNYAGHTTLFGLVLCIMLLHIV